MVFFLKVWKYPWDSSFHWSFLKLEDCSRLMARKHMQYATKAEPSELSHALPCIQASLQPFVAYTWASCWNLWGVSISDTPFSSEDLEKYFKLALLQAPFSA